MLNLKKESPLDESKPKKKRNSGVVLLFLIILYLVSVVVFVLWDTVRIDGKNFSRRTKKLDLDTLNAEEVPKLKKFRNLEWLFITRCNTDDISFLSDMPKLQVFSAGAVNPPVQDCTPAAACPDLYFFAVNKGAELENILDFSGMHSLTTLSLGIYSSDDSDNFVGTLDGADKLPAGIQKLTLSGLNPSSVSTEQFSQLINLEELTLRHSQIQEFSASSPSLNRLDISHNDLLKTVSLSPECKNLSYIYIQALPNLEFPMEDLLKLPDLKEIHISENQLTEQEIQKLKDKGILVDVYQNRD